MFTACLPPLSNLRFADVKSDALERTNYTTPIDNDAMFYCTLPLPTLIILLLIPGTHRDEIRPHQIIGRRVWHHFMNRHYLKRLLTAAHFPLLAGKGKVHISIRLGPHSCRGEHSGATEKLGTKSMFGSVVQVLPVGEAATIYLCVVLTSMGRTR